MSTLPIVQERSALFDLSKISGSFEKNLFSQLEVNQVKLRREKKRKEEKVKREQKLSIILTINYANESNRYEMKEKIRK